MRLLALPCFLVMAATSACAQQPAPSVVSPFPVAVAQSVPAAPAAAAFDVDSEAANVAAALRREVPRLNTHSAETDAYWVAKAQERISKVGQVIDHPQILVVVDRNPSVQEVNLILARADGPWVVLGGTHVSTGKPGRIEHFKTPVGVFKNSADILGYRALGTYNENHIRGIGVKGMRVWDFGWRDTENWRSPGYTSQIRLEMHATDPAVLEPRIGRPDSEGCVRLPSAMNRFIDHHGIIDADYEIAAQTQRRFAALLPADREVTPLAGDTLVVFDSSAPAL